MSYLQHPNSSYVSYDGTSAFNTSILDLYNYTIYSNGTLSNNTKCVLVFGRYRPTILPNGTILHGTSCDAPIEPIAIRGGLGITCAVIFGLFLIWCMINLRKHGASHMPVGEIGWKGRFRLVERRWIWYWTLLTAATGCISGFMAIDVDRSYILGASISLQSIFWWTTLPAGLCAGWEMTRHWGAWEERKIMEEDPFALRVAGQAEDDVDGGDDDTDGGFTGDDARQRIEFYLPIVFYPNAFLTFFLSILRSWSPITKQDAPTATDPRFKASTVFSLLAVLVIIASVVTSVYFYKPHQKPRISVFRFIPAKVPLVITLLLVRVAYGFAMVWDLGTGWKVSVMRAKVNAGWLYGLGYLPMLGVVAIICYAGWREENEDLVVMEARKQRGEAAGREEREMRKLAGREERRGLPPLPPAQPPLPPVHPALPEPASAPPASPPPAYKA